MKEDLHDIDHLFKTNLQEGSETPPDYVWDALEKSLDKKKVNILQRKVAVMKRMAAAMIVIISGFSAYEIASWNVKKEQEANAVTKDSVHAVSTSVPPSEAMNKRVRNDADSSWVDQVMQLRIKTNEHSPAAVHRFPEVINKKADRLSELKETTAASSTSANRKLLWKTRKPADDKPAKTMQNLSRGKDLNRTMRDDLSSGAGFPKTGMRMEMMPVPAYLPRIQSPDSMDISLLANKSIKSDMAASMLKAIQVRRQPAGSAYSRFSVTGFYSKDFNSNRLQTGMPAHRDEKREIERQEKYGSSYSLGLFVAFAMNGKWSVQSGLGFSQSVIDIAPKTIYARTDPRGNIRYRYNCSSGYSFFQPKAGSNPRAGDSISVSGSSNTMKYAAVPLSLQYHIDYGKFSIIPEGGIHLNLLMDQKIVTEVDNGTNKETQVMNDIEGLKSSYLSGVLKMSSRYAITDRIGIVFAPQLNIGLTSINKNAPVKSYRQSFSLLGGIQVEL